jgi:hypothetical protein
MNQRLDSLAPITPSARGAAQLGRDMQGYGLSDTRRYLPPYRLMMLDGESRETVTFAAGK